MLPKAHQGKFVSRACSRGEWRSVKRHRRPCMGAFDVSREIDDCEDTISTEEVEEHPI
jgi:hypothetical protein